jgi:hypothetical protein
VRERLRLAFARWGLPVRFRVDNGAPWGSTGEFPTELSLWLIGLGVDVHWNHAKRPAENGVVERSQRTAAGWCEPATCETPAELQQRLERMDRLYREVYPYRQRQSRMSFYPGLAHSGRPYDPASESGIWEWCRVAEHLSTYAVRRRVDRSGTISLYNRSRYVGTLHQGKTVYVMFDPEFNDWLISDAEGRHLGRVPAPELAPDRVMRLDVTRHRVRTK